VASGPLGFDPLVQTSVTPLVVATMLILFLHKNKKRQGISFLNTLDRGLL